MTTGDLQEWLKLFDDEMDVCIQSFDLENTGQINGEIISIKIDPKNNRVLLSDND